MTRPLTLISAALTLTATLLLATACSSPTQSTGDQQTPVPNATSPTPTPDATETAAPAAEPTCETIISPSLIAEFDDAGLTVKSEDFRIGELVIAGGVQCTWGNFDVASDHVQIYGWAPITADEARDAEAELLAAGWRRESSDEGVIISESTDTTISPDAQGYGLTYLFGDGWVKHADTKQSLILVTWPTAG